MAKPLRCDIPAQPHLYELLVSELTDFVVFLMGPTGCITSWNPGVERVLGYIDGEWLGRPAHIIFTPEDRAAKKPEEEMTKAAQDGRFPDIRWYQRKDGSRLFIKSTIVALKDDAGQLLGFYKVMRDITERKTAEEELRKSEERLTLALEAGRGMGTFDWDVPGDRLFYGAGLAQRLSIDPRRGSFGEPLAAVLNRIHPDDHAHLAERVQQALQTGEYSAVYRLLQEDGSVRWVDSRGRCERDAEGNPTRFAGLIFDITERKEAEEEREQLLQQIKAERQRLQQVFAQAPVAIAVFRGRDLVVELANPVYQALLQGRDVVGRRFADVMPDLGQEVWDVFRGVMDSGERYAANEWHIPYDYDQDGVLEDHWFNVAYYPLREPDGTVSGFVSVLTEVTAQVLARQELERVNRGLEEFAHVASHDLQEPLLTINRYSQLLIRRLGEEATDEQREFADFIQRAVKQMEQLIRDLLLYFRTVHTVDETAVGEASLNEALRQALAAVETRVVETGATIIYGPLPRVRGDTMQLTHVLQNLLSNSLKYRKPNESPCIVVGAERREGHWVVSVRDKGIGFEPAQAERIFGLFKRLHREEEYSGSGLGLAICKRIFERYGGTMWAEGVPGVGSSFFFSLPLVVR
jgi:PAS domain S-box-containing protein